MFALDKTTDASYRSYHWRRNGLEEWCMVFLPRVHSRAGTVFPEPFVVMSGRTASARTAGQILFAVSASGM
jgi:hypothetical protein